MTEKRFTRHKSLDGDCTIYDELNDFQFPSLPLGVSKIFCDKLNDVAEENEQLENEVARLKLINHKLEDKDYANYQKKIQDLIKKNNELKTVLNEVLKQLYNSETSLIYEYSTNISKDEKELSEYFKKKYSKYGWEE